MEYKTKEILAITDDLDFAYSKGKNLVLNITESDKIIVFSDLHRGNGGGNDDHRHSYATYLKALNYYLVKGYILILLGDVEELWENFDFEKIYNEYEGAYELEKLFFKKNTPTEPFYIRCFGNHDYRYSIVDFVKADLETVAGFHGLEVFEGIKLNFFQKEEKQIEIYLSHGHQGHYPRTTETLGSLSTCLFGVIQSATGRSTNQSIRSEPTFFKPMRRDTNRGYLKWGHRKGKVVIYGHTHEAVFMSKRLFDDAHIDMIENDESRIETSNAFNTGSCSFGSGEISGIEIIDGIIKLVQWTPDEESTSPETIQMLDGTLAEIELSKLRGRL